MFSGFHRILAGEKRHQTSCHSIVRAMHTRRGNNGKQCAKLSFANTCMNVWSSPKQTLSCFMWIALWFWSFFENVKCCQWYSRDHEHSPVNYNYKLFYVDSSVVLKLLWKCQVCQWYSRDHEHSPVNYNLSYFRDIICFCLRPSCNCCNFQLFNFSSCVRIRDVKRGTLEVGAEAKFKRPNRTLYFTAQLLTSWFNGNFSLTG